MKHLTQTLRKQQTNAERTLWAHLRDRQLSGFKFRRQEIIGPYIVDFVRFEPKLIVEADGGQHADGSDRDAKRNYYLESLGYQIVRFWNHEILSNVESVLERIHTLLINSPHPCPPPEGEGENLLRRVPSLSHRERVRACPRESGG